MARKMECENLFEKFIQFGGPMEGDNKTAFNMIALGRIGEKEIEEPFAGNFCER